MQYYKIAVRRYFVKAVINYFSSNAILRGKDPFSPKEQNSILALRCLKESTLRV